MTTYTHRKVYAPLAALLPAGAPTTADITRFSVEGDLAGSAAQRATYCSTYGNDPAVKTVSALPDQAWDPDHPDVGEKHGIVWVRMQDLHHSADGDDPVAAVTLVDDHIFASITLSSTLRHIRREDGEDENGYTRLLLSLINHYPSLRRIRWVDDITRAGREPADWATVKAKCKYRDVAMVLGGRHYDLKNSADELALGALGLVGAGDDPLRRRKLTGKRLVKYVKGGAAIAETQMPHGWHHQRDEYGRPVKDGDKGLTPEPTAEMVPVIQALYQAHADGESYQTIAKKMIEFEAQGALIRRDHVNPGNTYASTTDDTNARYDAAKSFFVRSSFTPKPPPSEGQISRYLAGEDPAEVFDAHTRLYLGKVELVRTGRYYRRLRNDIRGRNQVLDGRPATYADEDDEYGWFDVHSAPWPWPVDKDGKELPRFGLTDDTCRQVGARLLRELRAPSAPTGGRAHRGGERRVLQNFTNWTVETSDPTARYADELTEYGIEARQNNSGKENFILLFRRPSVVQASGRRGWSNLGVGESKSAHIAATASLAELAASASVNLDAAVRELLEPESVAMMSSAPTEPDVDPTASWEHQIERKTAEGDKARADAEGLRVQAGRKAAAGDFEAADRYDRQAATKDQEAASIEAELEGLETKIRQHQASAESARREREDRGDISIAAYLVVGLEQAAANNGRTTQRLGVLCDTTFSGWRFTTSGEDLAWSCVCRLPLASGETADLPLAGTIRNVRTRAGKALATTTTVVRYVFEEGRDLSDVARLLEATRKTLLVKRIMPWLVETGVTARGAKCALVDHPIADVRRELYRRLTERPGAGEPTNPYLRLLHATYLDPALAWGDAAVPDDTTWIQSAIDMLTADTETRRSGLPVLDVALALGRSEDDIRELVKPQRRSAGFTRPRYLTYTDKAKTKVKAVGCPHGRCKGRRFANHVALFPEVAASGYGVICSHCRRTPALDDDWPLTQFPATYLKSWTSRGDNGSLRVAARTVPSPASA